MSIISDEECEAQTSDSVTVAEKVDENCQWNCQLECITTQSSYEGRISEDMLCAGAPGKDACQAQDSLESQDTYMHK